MIHNTIKNFASRVALASLMMVGATTILAVGPVAAPAAHAAASGSAPQAISIKQVPGLGGNVSINAINKWGDVVGTAWDSSGLRHGFVYTHTGVFRELAGLGAFNDSAAYSINDNGEIVGEANYEAAYWDAQGNLTQLDEGDPNTSAASTIDNADHIYGTIQVDTGTSCGGDGLGSSAASFALGGGATALDTPSADCNGDTQHTKTWSAVDAGWPAGGVVGTRVDDVTTKNADGTWNDVVTYTVHNYATGADLGSSIYASPYGVNGNGATVGLDAAPNTTDTQGALWNGAETFLGGLSNYGSTALGVNDSLDVVGSSTVSTSPADDHAFLWRNGTMYDLRSLFPELGTAEQATAINDADQIGINSNGDAFVAQVTTDDPLTISGIPANGVINTPYDWTFTTTGTPTSFTVTSGTLPPGLTLDPITGTISGTPMSQGKYGPITITVSDGTTAASTTVTLEVDGPPTIVNGANQIAALNQPYSFSFEVDATPDPVLTVTKGTLPVGLTLDPYQFALSGTPTKLGTSTFTVTASNGFTPNSSVNVTFTVAATYTITPASGPAGTRITISGPATAGTALTATYDTGTGQVKLCSAKTSKSGTFTCNGRIPAANTAGPKAAHQILISTTNDNIVGVTSYTLS